MHNSTSGSGPDPMRSIARELLDEHLDRLTDDALVRLMKEEPAYAELTMDAAVRRSGMLRTLELALRRVAGEELPPLELRATTQVGRERAEQGFPLPALMHSFQLDLRVLWEAVLVEAGRRRIASDPAFQNALIRVWEATDANTVEVVSAFRQTERDLSDARNEQKSRAFERLVRESDRDVAGVQEAASVLGLPADQSVLVLVADDIGPGSDELRRCREALRRSSTLHHLAWLGDELIGLFVVGRTGERAIVEAISLLSEGTSGVARATNLQGAATGARLARAAARGANAPGLHRLEDSWVGAVATADSELGAALVQEVLGRLLSANDREPLLETLRSYLTIGSVAGVAEKTYRHRNTVRNRLSSIEQLCGLDLSLPRDLTTLTLALSCWEAQGQRRSVPVTATTIG